MGRSEIFWGACEVGGWRVPGRSPSSPQICDGGPVRLIASLTLWLSLLTPSERASLWMSNDSRPRRMVSWGTAEWKAAVQAVPAPDISLKATGFVRQWGTYSKPVAVLCSDNQKYVLKGLRHDQDQARAIFNDQVAARLGHACGAPVPEVAMVELPRELIAINPAADQLGHMLPGACHASLYVDQITERVDAFQHCDDGDNRKRFASTGMFQAWLSCLDRQFIYRTVAPFEVYSCDHGHYFPGGPPWTVQTLASAPLPEVASDLIIACGLDAPHLKKAAEVLAGVTNDQIAAAVALPPDAWGVSIDERAELAGFLAKRRDMLSTKYA